ncbi:hypothetical protein MPSEU_000052900 [Mayamaea pseudoterrestris]|nr:hypothetical protein MPSEU_000052900 [Mayamaea pseudoterrestris]
MKITCLCLTIIATLALSWKPADAALSRPKQLAGKPSQTFNRPPPAFRRNKVQPASTSSASSMVHSVTSPRTALKVLSFLMFTLGVASLAMPTTYYIDMLGLPKETLTDHVRFFMTFCNIRETLFGVFAGLAANYASLEMCKTILQIVLLVMVPAQIYAATSMKHVFVSHDSYVSLVAFQLAVGAYFAVSLYLNK